MILTNFYKGLGYSQQVKTTLIFANKKLVIFTESIIELVKKCQPWKYVIPGWHFLWNRKLYRCFALLYMKFLQKCFCALVLWIVNNILGLPVLHHVSVIHKYDTVRNHFCEIYFMGNDNHRHFFGCKLF